MKEGPKLRLLVHRGLVDKELTFEREAFGAQGAAEGIIEIAARVGLLMSVKAKTELK